MSALLAARLALRGSRTPLLIEFRDLWGHNPAYDAGGKVLPAVVRWLLRGACATVVTSPEAASELEAMDPSAPPTFLVPNGFEPELLEYRTPGSDSGLPKRIIHSGALVAGRPLSPLLQALADWPDPGEFELILQGYLAPEALAELAAYRGRVNLKLRGTVPWAEAMKEVAAADAGLVAQSHEVGDATAVAAKVYEYVALGKPVLCISDGGATERLLRELAADEFCARLDRPESIARALQRLTEGTESPPVPPDPQRYSRDHLAREMSTLLNSVQCA